MAIYIIKKKFNEGAIELMNNFLKVILIISLLVVSIVTAGIATNHVLGRDSKVLEEYITKMEFYLKDNDWLKTETTLEDTREYWSKIQNKWTILQSHFETDDIDSALIRVSELTKAREPTLALVEMALLREFIRHIPEKSAFKLKNIL